MNDDTDTPSGEFPETRWTLVRRATQQDEPGSFEALSELCERYWYPLYAFVRGQGAPPSDAADEVQGFFATLLERDFLEAADEEKGKLRSFLIDLLKKYRSNEYRARQALKRGGGTPHLSINQEWAEGRYEAEPVDDLTPEQILDRSWARLILDKVMDQLQADFRRRNKVEEFQAISPFLSWNSGEGNYADTASRLGISKSNVKVKVHRMRAKYRQILEGEVSQTLDSSNRTDLEDELNHLLAALG